MEIFGYIYLIIDHWNNKVYVGQKSGLPENSLNYFGSGVKITQIRKQINPIHFEKRILGLCYSENELDEAETECIYFYRAFGSDGKNLDEIYGYNLKPKAKGSNSRGKKRSIESRRKISLSLIGSKRHTQKHSEESKKKMSESHRNISDETRKKMSLARIGKEPWNKGKEGVYSDETLEKMRTKGRELSEIGWKKRRENKINQKKK